MANKYINFSRKKLPLLIVLFLIGVLLLVVSSFIPSGGQGQDTSEIPVVGQENGDTMTRGPAETSGLAEVENEMENRLEAFLSAIEGVGSVSVTVTLENGPQYIYAVNENINESKIEEKNDSGGHRITTETTNSDQMVLAQSADMGGGQQPVVVKEIKPKIAGILVAAEGAVNPDIRVTLTRAVQTLYDIPAHKVKVLQKTVD